jgi:hypothetical protein
MLAIARSIALRSQRIVCKPADRVQVGKRCKFVRGYSIKWVGNFLGLLRQDRASRPYVCIVSIASAPGATKFS